MPSVREERHYTCDSLQGSTVPRSFRSIGLIASAILVGGAIAGCALPSGPQDYPDFQVSGDSMAQVGDSLAFEVYIPQSLCFFLPC